MIHERQDIVFSGVEAEVEPQMSRPMGDGFDVRHRLQNEPARVWEHRE